ncbi:MAG TPA: transposase [Gaiellaceae bacterium]|jgi:REP element-mobilizing transposase RayT|nr:transposase [Gaiellaceae bacterium]
MGRANREQDRETLFHVVSRGNNGERIVRDAVDTASFRAELDRVSVKYEWEVWAWCLLSNHFHLVLRTPKLGLSEGMQELNGNHARRMNRRHDRTGHLVRNRFFSVALETEAHAVAAILYVARNPVKAGLCASPAAWRDGGYRATAGLEQAPPWLAVGSVLSLFGEDDRQAVATYRDFVHAGHLPVSDTIEEVSRVERGSAVRSG